MNAPSGKNNAPPGVQIIKLPNVILEKIGGIEAAKKAFGPDVLTRVQDAIDSQAEEFVGVIHKYINDMNALSADAASFDAEAIEKTRLIAHELRGISGTFGFHLITRVSASLWNFLGEFGDGRDMVHGIVRMHIDTLVAAQAASGEDDAVALQVEKGLHSVIEKLRAAG